MQDSGQGERGDWLPPSVRDAGVNRALGPGDFLFRIDTPTAGLFEVIKGRIKLVRIAPSGLVSHVDLPPDQRETVLGNCIRKAVFGATFPRKKKETLISFPLHLEP